MKKKLGIHMSLTGGYDKQLKKASDAGAKTVQIFSGNPTAWKPPALDKDMAAKFIKAQKRYNISPLIFHTPYLINLASPKDDIHNKSVELLKASIKKAEIFKAPYVVTHIGSHLGEGVKKGIYNIRKAIEKISHDISDDVMLLLENTVGSGNSMGASFFELKQIFAEVKEAPISIGFCFDSAHAFGAGYELSTLKGVRETMKELKENIPLDLIKVVHANDTVEEKGSKKDKHEDITKGKIGEEGFFYFLNSPELSEVEGVILETPKRTENSDKENMERLRRLVNNYSQGYG